MLKKKYFPNIEPDQNTVPIYKSKDKTKTRCLVQTLSPGHVENVPSFFAISQNAIYTYIIYLQHLYTTVQFKMTLSTLMLLKFTVAVEGLV